MQISNLLISKRVLTAFVVFFAIMFLKYNPVAITFLILLISKLTFSSSIKPLKNYKFWIAIFILIVIVPIFSGEQNSFLLWISYSSEMLDKTIFMSLRGISIFMLIQVITTDINPEKLQDVLNKSKLTSLNFLIEISQKTLPQAKSILKTNFDSIKKEKKSRRIISLIIDAMSRVLAEFIRLARKLEIDRNTKY